MASTAERFVSLLNEWIMIAETESNAEGELEWLDVYFKKPQDPDASLGEFVAALLSFADQLCPEGYEVSVTPERGFSIVRTEDAHGR